MLCRIIGPHRNGVTRVDLVINGMFGNSYLREATVLVVLATLFRICFASLGDDFCVQA